MRLIKSRIWERDEDKDDEIVTTMHEDFPLKGNVYLIGKIGSRCAVAHYDTEGQEFDRGTLMDQFLTEFMGI